jgi:ArsR family transcriptional regulator
MTQQQYADVFKALSHASRLQLLELLAQQGELSVSELTELMPREGSTISRHLSLLNLQGLVTVRQEAQNRYYALNPQRIQRVFEGFLRERLEPKPVARP